MNSCILMAEIVQAPQLRYTTEQMAIAEMLVQFSGLRAEDPPATLKVVGWGNLAQDIQQNYHQGDRVILEGRLNMNTVERPEGFKEKRAELTVQKIHSLSADNISVGATATNMTATNNVTAETSVQSRPATAGSRNTTTVEKAASAAPEELRPQPKSNQPANYPLPTPEADDDIPF